MKIAIIFDEKLWWSWN